MCGITGGLIEREGPTYQKLINASQLRGQDGTGVTVLRPNNNFLVVRSDRRATDTPEIQSLPLEPDTLLVGQNRLAFFGLDHENDQPIMSERFALVHNGNLHNFEQEFETRGLQRSLQVDTELILRIIEQANPSSPDMMEKVIKDAVLPLKGDMACLLLDRQLRCLVAFRKYMPLWTASDQTGKYFFSTDRIGKKVFPEVEQVPPFSVTINFR